MANAVCHPDNISYHNMSSGYLAKLVSDPDELRKCYYVIQMTYLSTHSDKIANFDFSQHAMALQCFRI